MLTTERIIEIAAESRAAEPGDNGYVLPVTFARAIEKELADRDRALIALLLDALEAHRAINAEGAIDAARARLEKEQK
jgi:hypothetical protein